MVDGRGVGVFDVAVHSRRDGPRHRRAVRRVGAAEDALAGETVEHGRLAGVVGADDDELAHGGWSGRDGEGGEDARRRGKGMGINGGGQTNG